MASTDENRLGSSHASVTAATFVEGSEGVTHEELSTLKHLPDALPFAAFLVVAVEFAERWTYYGEFCNAPRAIRRRSESPILTQCRLQRQSPYGGITSVQNFRLVQPLVPSPPTTGPTVSRVLSGVVYRLRLRFPTSTYSGFTLLPSWAGSSQIVTWADTRRFSTSLSFVCGFQMSLPE